MRRISCLHRLARLFAVILVFQLIEKWTLAKKHEAKTRSYHNANTENTYLTALKKFKNFTFGKNKTEHKKLHYHSKGRRFVNKIFSPDDIPSYNHRKHVDVNGTRRDIVLLSSPADLNALGDQSTQVFQNQLYQNERQYLPKAVLNLIGTRREPQDYDNDNGISKNPNENPYAVLPPTRSYSDPSYQIPQASEPLVSSVASKTIYEDNVPSDLYKMQGLQETEESLVGKLLSHTPSGTSRKPPADPALVEQQELNKQQQLPMFPLNKSWKPDRSAGQEPYGFNSYGNEIDNILLDKMLSQPKETQNTTCDSEMVALLGNCSKSEDPLCHDADVESFRRNGLEQHKRLRSIHSSPALELNDMLNHEAQEYSEKLADSPRLAYSDPKERPGQGENIAVRCSDDGSTLTAKEAVNYWYKKVCKDDTDMTQYSPDISQFAQVVWKDSNFLGLGRTTRPKGNLVCTYIVARYSPQASKNGFLENVPHGKFSGNQVCSRKCVMPGMTTESKSEDEKVFVGGSHVSNMQSLLPMRDHVDTSKEATATDTYLNTIDGQTNIPGENDGKDFIKAPSNLISGVTEVPMVIKQHDHRHIIVPGSENGLLMHIRKPVQHENANSRQVKDSEPPLITHKTEHDTHSFDDLQLNHASSEKTMGLSNSIKKPLHIQKQETNKKLGKTEKKFFPSQQKHLDHQRGDSFMSRFMSNRKDHSNTNFEKSAQYWKDKELDHSHDTHNDDDYEDDKEYHKSTPKEYHEHRAHYTGHVNDENKEKEENQISSNQPKEKQKVMEEPAAMNKSKPVSSELVLKKLKTGDGEDTEPKELKDTEKSKEEEEDSTSKTAEVKEEVKAVTTSDKIIKKFNDNDSDEVKGIKQLTTNNVNTLDFSSGKDGKVTGLATDQDARENTEDLKNQEDNQIEETKEKQNSNDGKQTKAVHIKKKDNSINKETIHVQSHEQNKEKGNETGMGRTSTGETQLPDNELSNSTEALKPTLDTSSSQKQQEMKSVNDTSTQEENNHSSEIVKQNSHHATGEAKTDLLKASNEAVTKKPEILVFINSTDKDVNRIQQKMKEIQQKEEFLKGSARSHKENNQQTEATIPAGVDQGVTKEGVGQNDEQMNVITENNVKDLQEGTSISGDDEDQYSMETGDLSDTPASANIKLDSTQERADQTENSNKILGNDELGTEKHLSNSTEAGMNDLNILEKASSKTSEPATRQILQTFFDVVKTEENNKGPFFIQLIPAKELNDFRQDMIMQHNKYRALHGSPELVLDNQLSRDAQLYAAYVAKHGTVAHSDPDERPDVGESVAEMCTKEGVLPTAQHVVNKWYSEICHPGYDFTKEEKQAGTGHFTQIIWKDTHKLGVGLAVADRPNGDSCSYVVARYKNAGNYLDRFKDNIQEGNFVRSKCRSDFDEGVDPLLGNINIPVNTSENETGTKRGDFIFPPIRVDKENDKVSVFHHQQLLNKHIAQTNPVILNDKVNSKANKKEDRSVGNHTMKRQEKTKNHKKGQTREKIVTSKTLHDVDYLVDNSVSADDINYVKPRHVQLEFQISADQENQEKSSITRYNTKKKTRDTVQSHMSNKNFKRSRKRRSLPRSDEMEDALYDHEKGKKSTILKNHLKISSIHKGNHHKANSKKRMKSEDDYIIAVSTNENLHPGETVSTKNFDLIEKVSGLERDASKEHKPGKLSTRKSLGNHFDQSDVHASTHQSSDQSAIVKKSILTNTSRKNKTKKGNQHVHLGKIENANLSKAEIESELDKFVTERPNNKLKQRGHSKIKKNKSHIENKQYTVLPIDSHNHVKHKIRKDGRVMEAKKNLSERTVSHRNYSQKLINHRHSARHEKSIGHSDDRELENYLKNIVIKLRQFDKQTDKKNKAKFDKEIKTFAELNEKAIKLKANHTISKQSAIPNPTKKLQNFVEDIGKRRSLDVGADNPVTSNMAAYVKSLNNAPTVNSRRLITINSMLKAPNAGDVLDQPTDTELESLNGFYKQDLSLADNEVMHIAPMTKILDSFISNGKTTQRDEVENEQSKTIESESINEGGKAAGETSIPDESSILNDQENSKFDPAVESVKTALEHAQNQNLDVSPDEIQAINREAKEVGDHIDNEIFYHDNDHQLTFFKPTTLQNKKSSNRDQLKASQTNEWLLQANKLQTDGEHETKAFDDSNLSDIASHHQPMTHFDEKIDESMLPIDIGNDDSNRFAVGSDNELSAETITGAKISSFEKAHKPNSLLSEAEEIIADHINNQPIGTAMAVKFNSEDKATINSSEKGKGNQAANLHVHIKNAMKELKGNKEKVVDSLKEEKQHETVEKQKDKSKKKETEHKEIMKALNIYFKTQRDNKTDSKTSSDKEVVKEDQNDDKGKESKKIEEEREKESTEETQGKMIQHQNKAEEGYKEKERKKQRESDSSNSRNEKEESTLSKSSEKESTSESVKNIQNKEEHDVKDDDTNENGVETNDSEKVKNHHSNELESENADKIMEKTTGIKAEPSKTSKLSKDDDQGERQLNNEDEGKKKVQSIKFKKLNDNDAENENVSEGGDKNKSSSPSMKFKKLKSEKLSDKNDDKEKKPMKINQYEDKGQTDNEDDMSPVKLPSKPSTKKPLHQVLSDHMKHLLHNSPTGVLNKPLGSQPTMEGQSDILTDADYQMADEVNLGERPSSPSLLQQSALMAHNKLRKIHHAPSLELSEELSRQAQRYAQELVRKHEGVLIDSPFETRPDQGENLAMNCDPKDAEMTGEEASYKWYAEICEHGYDFNQVSQVAEGTKHFSQLIWKSSRYFGIGKTILKRNGMTCTLVVARYQPRGNIPDHFQMNIDEGDFDASVCDGLTTKALETTKEFPEQSVPPSVVVPQSDEQDLAEGDHLPHAASDLKLPHHKFAHKAYEEVDQHQLLEDEEISNFAEDPEKEKAEDAIGDDSLHSSDDVNHNYPGLSGSLSEDVGDQDGAKHHGPEEDKTNMSLNKSQNHKKKSVHAPGIKALSIVTDHGAYKINQDKLNAVHPNDGKEGWKQDVLLTNNEPGAWHIFPTQQHISHKITHEVSNVHHVLEPTHLMTFHQLEKQQPTHTMTFHQSERQEHLVAPAVSPDENEEASSNIEESPGEGGGINIIHHESKVIQNVFQHHNQANIGGHAIAEHEADSTEPGHDGTEAREDNHRVNEKENSHPLETKYHQPRENDQEAISSALSKPHKVLSQTDEDGHEESMKVNSNDGHGGRSDGSSEEESSHKESEGHLTEPQGSGMSKMKSPMPEKKPSTPLRPVSDEGKPEVESAKFGHGDASDKLNEQSLESQHHEARPVKGPTDGEEKAHGGSASLLPHGHTEHNQEMVKVDRLGQLPSFGFASFGSPVILHIGSTGFFEDPAAFLRIGLSTHNKLRKIHGSPPMTIDPMLTMQAYQHAVALTNLGYLKHQDPDVLMGMGENLFLGCYDGEYDISAEEAVLRWYAEVCHPGYCYNKSTTCSGTGHFTQVVWSNSTRLGMAKATRLQNGLRCTYIVARYFPSGNENDGYNENVRKGAFVETQTCGHIFDSLTAFEKRNEAKAVMVEKERLNAREEFLKSLQKTEQHILNQMRLEQLKKEEHTEEGHPSVSQNNHHEGQFQLTHGSHRGTSPQQEVEKERENSDPVIAINIQNDKTNQQAHEPLKVGYDKWEQQLHDSETSDGHTNEENHQADTLQASIESEKQENGTTFHVGDNENHFHRLLSEMNDDHKDHHDIKMLLGLKIRPGHAHNDQLVHPTDLKEEPPMRHDHDRVDGAGHDHDRVDGADTENKILGSFLQRIESLDALSEKSSQNSVKVAVENQANTVEDETSRLSNATNNSVPDCDDSQGFTKRGIMCRKTKAKEMIELNDNQVHVEVDDDPQSRTHVSRYGNVKQKPRHENSDRHSDIVIHVDKDSKNEPKVTIEDSKTRTHSKNKETKPKNKLKASVNTSNSDADAPHESLKNSSEGNQDKSHDDKNSDSKGHSVHKPKLPDDVDKPLNHSANNKLTDREQSFESSNHGNKKIQPNEHFDEATTDEDGRRHGDENFYNSKPTNESSYSIHDDSSTKHDINSHAQTTTSLEGHHFLPPVGAFNEPKHIEISHSLQHEEVSISNGHDSHNQDAHDMLHEFHAEQATAHDYDNRLPDNVDKLSQAGTEDQDAIHLRLDTAPIHVTEPETEQLHHVSNNEDPSTNVQQTSVPDHLTHNIYENGILPTVNTVHYTDTSHVPASPVTDNHDEHHAGNTMETSATDHLQGSAISVDQRVHSLPNTEQQVEPEYSLSKPPVSTTDLLTTHIVEHDVTHGLKTTDHVVTLHPPAISSSLNPNIYQHLSTDESPAVRISCGTDSSHTGHHTSLNCAENLNSAKPLAFDVPDTGDISVLQLSALNSHNMYRHTHMVPTLKLNQDMSKEATEHAKRIAKLGKLQHSTTEDGENIAAVCRDKNILMTGEEASTIWYREVCDPGYDFNTAQPGKAGHFTQVVWKGSQDFGIGRAAEMHNGLLCTYIVARYRPAGNFIGEFAENVPRGHFNSQQCVNLARKDYITPHPHFHKRSSIPKIRQPRITNRTNGVAISRMRRQDHEDVYSNGVKKSLVPLQSSSENPHLQENPDHWIQKRHDSLNGSQSLSEAATDTNTSVLQLSALNSHNAYREIHMVPPLRLNEDMSKEAAEYAKNIAKDKTIRFSGTEDGENIVTVCRENHTVMTGEEASTIWYQEVCDPGYDFNTTQLGKAGHFTQVVWKGSQEFGIGRATGMHDGLLCTSIVARYRPVGNIIGEFADNVPQGNFNLTECASLTRKDEIIFRSRRHARLNNVTDEAVIGRIKRHDKAAVGRMKRHDEAAVGRMKGHDLGEAYSSTVRKSLLPLQELSNEKRSRKNKSRRKTNKRKSKKRTQIKEKVFKKKVVSTRQTGKNHKSNIKVKKEKRKKIPKQSKNIGKKKKVKSQKLKSEDLDDTIFIRYTINEKDDSKVEKKKVARKTKLKKTSKKTSHNTMMENKINRRTKKISSQILIGRAQKKDKTPHQVLIPVSTLSELVHEKTLLSHNSNAAYIHNVEGDKREKAPLTLSSTVLNEGRHGIDSDSPEAILAKELRDDREVSDSSTQDFSQYLNQNILFNTGGFEELGSSKKTNTYADGAESKTAINNFLSDQTKKQKNKSNNQLLPSMEDGVFKNNVSESDNDSPSLNAGGSLVISSLNNKPVNRNWTEVKIDKNDVKTDEPTNTYDVIQTLDKQEPDHKVKVKFLDHKGIITPLSGIARKLSCQPGNALGCQVATKSRLKSNNTTNGLFASPDFHPDVLNNQTVLHQNQASIAAAQKLGKYLLGNSKTEDENKALLAMSNLADQASLPSDLLLGESGMKSATDVLKMAKIGTIALQLARKKAIQQKIIDSMHASHLQGADLLQHLQQAQNQNKFPDMQNFVSSSKPFSNSLDGNSVGLLENVGTQASNIGTCGGEMNCMANSGEVSAVEGQFKTLAREAVATLPQNQSNELSNNTILDPAAQVATNVSPQNISNSSSGLIQTNPSSFAPSSAINANVSKLPTSEPSNIIISNTTNVPPSTPSGTLNSNVVSFNAPDIMTASIPLKAKEMASIPVTTQDTEFEEAALNAHNTFRNAHDAHQLVLDAKLNQEAHDRAQRIATLGGRIETSDVKGAAGENTAIVCKDSNQRQLMTGPDAVMKWYNQVCIPEYVFGVERPQKNAEQFQQVVWRETTKLGVGRSTFEKSGNFCTVIVAKYFPGVDEKQAKSNVIQGSFDHNAYCNGLGSVVDIGATKDTKSSAAQPGLSENTQDFRQEALNLQNEFRAVHGSPSMGLDDSLCLSAEQFATQLAKEGQIRHSDTNDGESLVKSCNMNMIEMTGDEAVRKWYNEVCNPGYSFITDIPAGGTSSFTQMVWKSTHLFGIGKATTKEDGMLCTYLVARYREKGNMPGGYKSNVPRGAFDFAYCESLGKPLRRAAMQTTSEMKLKPIAYKRNKVSKKKKYRVISTQHKGRRKLMSDKRSRGDVNRIKVKANTTKRTIRNEYAPVFDVGLSNSQTGGIIYDSTSKTRYSSTERNEAENPDRMKSEVISITGPAEDALWNVTNEKNVSVKNVSDSKKKLTVDEHKLNTSKLVYDVVVDSKEILNQKSDLMEQAKLGNGTRDLAKQPGNATHSNLTADDLMSEGLLPLNESIAKSENNTPLFENYHQKTKHSNQTIDGFDLMNVGKTESRVSKRNLRSRETLRQATLTTDDIMGYEQRTPMSENLMSINKKKSKKT